MDFYPRSPCGERLTPARMLSRLLEISIHALLAESDNRGSYHVKRHKNFYPRSPCGERQGHRRCSFCPSNISIHALLAESDHSARPDTRQHDVISIHALLAESDPPAPQGESSITISIHALLAESDGGVLSNSFVKIIFLSTLSLRRATSGTAQHT